MKPCIPLTKEQFLSFLSEDGTDKTTAAVSSLKNQRCSFEFLCKEKEGFIFCGSEILNIALSAIQSKDFEVEILKKDGSEVLYEEVIISGSANCADFLLIERTTLNLMQQLSGVSTCTFKMVNALSNNKIKILDTRKTIPGLRTLQKYAVKCGGGFNHRFGLFDMIMIKDNHIKAAGGLLNAIEAVLSSNKDGLQVEVECETIKEVSEAIKHKIDIIMLDNMSIDKIREASKIIRQTPIKIELSGGIGLNNIRDYRDLDVDFISSGELTHSVNSVDISAKIIL